MVFLPENTCPSIDQPIRRLSDAGVAVAIGASSPVRGTPCRQTAWLAVTLANGSLWSNGCSIQMLIALIKGFQWFSTIAERDYVEHWKRSFSFAHIMANGDTSSQGTFGAAVVATLVAVQADSLSLYWL